MTSEEKMTPEEAIAYGKECLSWNEFSKGMKMYQFIEMAIQALEQVECFTNGRGEVIVCDEFKDMPCTDAVSRQAVIMECIKYADHEHNVRLKKEVSETRKHDAQVIIYACDYFKTFVEKLPTVNPQPCDDAISREAALKRIAQFSVEEGSSVRVQPLYSDVYNMPPVTQKPIECDDAVSRQAVLEKLNEWDWQELYLPIHFKEHIIDELPSVTLQESKWIPVSERLPEDKTYVLTTIKVPNRVAHARSGWYQSGYFHNDNGDTWRATDIEVKAWMPLPEPYEPQEKRCENCNHYGKLSLDCGRCDDDCSMFEPQESEE